MSVFNYPESLKTGVEQIIKFGEMSDMKKRERKNSLFNEDGSLNIRKVSRDIMNDLLVVPEISRTPAELANKTPQEH